MLKKLFLPIAKSYRPVGTIQFQQDTATAHTAKSDLNPMEQIWSLLEFRVLKHHPSNKEELMSQFAIDRKPR